MKSVEKGDKVKVEYTGKLEDGTVFDSSEKHGAPLEFEVGAGQVISGFDEAIVGMKKDEEKKITLAPEDAYGERNEELIKDIPKESFPQDQEIKPGMVFMMKVPDGRQFPAVISEVKDNAVTVDLNPPLAGKTLVFEIKLLEIAS